MGKARYLYSAVAIALVTVGFVTLKGHSWPEGGKDRIDWMAEKLRRIQRPANWCSETKNAMAMPLNTKTNQLGICLGRIEPVSTYLTEPDSDYMKRFYRAKIDDHFCEVTLSVFSGERLVGSDCYYGLFRNGEDSGIGMTDDPFG